MSELDDELARNEDLWRMWQADGVTEDTILAVDFFFYATSKSAAQDLAEALRKAGRKVEVRTTRTLVFFRGWEITAVEEGMWSLAKLQDRSRTYCRVAELLRVTYDGCGAMMPDNDAA